MSSFGSELAEARILIRPDTARFRTDLEAQLKSVLARPVKIPVIPVVGPGFAAAAAGTTAFAAAQESAAAATVVTAEALAAATTIQRQYAGAADLSTVSTLALASAQEKEAVAATAASVANSRAAANATKGIIAQIASLLGLRAGTLAASSAFIGGTVAVLAFAKAIQSAASLETELNVFRVTAGATADEMERVSESAKQLGRDITLPGVTAGSAAIAMTELAKAGLSVQDALDGARGTLQLATAAQIEVADATKLVAGALNAFGLAGTDAVKIADLLTGAAKESQGEITDMSTALGQAAAVSHQFGVSVEDTITLLTELAQAGIAGGRAGTSLRVAFLRLVNPPAAAAKALKELNVQIRDAAGNLRPQIFTDIAKALQGYTKAQRDARLATIFGSDAIRTAAIIGSKGTLAFQQTRDAVTEAGLAQEQAAARTQGFEGDVSNLANQVEALGLSIGQVAKGPVGAFVRALGAATGAINETVSAAEKTGFFEEFGKSIGEFATSFSRLNLEFRQGVSGANDASERFTVFDAIVKTVTKDLDAAAAAFQGAFDAALAQRPVDRGLGVTQIQNVVAGFDAKAVRDRIAKDNKQLIADLQAEQDFLVGQLQRQFVKNRPALKRALEQSLLGVVTDIDAIQNKAAADAKAAREKAEKAARDAAAAATAREQALLASFGVARDQQQNKIAQEALKAGLQGDIDAQEGLRRLVLKQIAAVKKLISAQGGQKAVLTGLKAILIQVDAAKAALIKQQLDAQAERRQNLIEAATLDIDFFQTTENKAAEINARKKLISQLKAEQALVKAGTLEWKRLRNDIAAQNAAIKALNAERLNQKNLFAQASFDFLQAQQGFASNLLGNLIPTGSTAGLVGGTSVTAALPPLANANAAQSQSGFTQGQGQATNGILLRILDQMKLLNGTQAAPEANWQAKQTLSSLDGVGGG